MADTDRAYVTCHMTVSLDGKIDGTFHRSPASAAAAKYYYDVIFDLGSSMAGGKATTLIYSPQPKIDYGRYAGDVVPEGDFVVKSPEGRYCLVYDRMGACAWDRPTTEMGGVEMQLVEVVSPGVRPEYLAHLREVGVAYIVASGHSPVTESLAKLKRLFGTGNVVLTGGAQINGGFLAEDAIDELSLVVLPYVSGDASGKSLMETAGFNELAFGFAEAKPLEGGAVHLRFKRIR